jgi:SAM-dependent methyltransferase
MTLDSSARFRGRVDAYVAYRPHYPEALVEALCSWAKLDEKAVVADLGSGTGIFTQPLLDRVARVYAVEPNDEMRAAAQRLLGAKPGFVSVTGRAEATTLPDGCADLATAAQAFHWFELDGTRRELRRILREKKRVAMIWNERDTTRDAMHRQYEQLLLDHGIDYAQVGPRHGHQDGGSAEYVRAFFGSAQVQELVFENVQRLDWAGVVGRLASTSYLPAPSAPGYPGLLADAKALFAAHQQGGHIELRYNSQLFVGCLD